MSTAKALTMSDLRAAGWRQSGKEWRPPWPSPWSYTLAAAKLEQAIIAAHAANTPKRATKRIKTEGTP